MKAPESASPGLIAQSNRLRISNSVTFSTHQPAPRVRKNLNNEIHLPGLWTERMGEAGRAFRLLRLL